MIMKLIFIVRSIIASGIFILATVVYGGLVIVLAGLTGNPKVIDILSWLWGRTTELAFNLHVHREGDENLPKEGCLFIFNHTSHFDIITIYGQLKKSARFGAKIELFKIPLFGRILRSTGMLPIARSNREGVLKLYEDSIVRVRNGESFLLAAEGTRQTSPGVGAKFKSGPFIFAINGQFPIVPVVLKGATECLPKGQLLACTDRWRHDIKLKFLPPISTVGLTLDDRARLQEETRDLMAKAYEEM